MLLPCSTLFAEVFGMTKQWDCGADPNECGGWQVCEVCRAEGRVAKAKANRDSYVQRELVRDANRPYIEYMQQWEERNPPENPMPV